MPYIQATVEHGTLDQLKDAMDVWVESVSTTEFEVCLRESRTFDGPHGNLYVVCHYLIAGAKEEQLLIRSGMYLRDGHHI